MALGLLGIVSGRRRRAAALAIGGFVYLLGGGLSPLGNWLICPLEQRFPRPPAMEASEDIRGIIILGGGEDGRISTARGDLALNEAAERITEGARLARRMPRAKVVFSGGVGGLWPGETGGTRPVAQFFADMGIAPERIQLEARSRNTYENAVFTRDLVKPQPGERWVLVTSAYHIPRAVGAFRQAGFDIAVYPVDYRTAGTGDLVRPFDGIPDGLKRADVAVKEWMGLVAYRLMGRSTSLFPAPSAAWASGSQAVLSVPRGDRTSGTSFQRDGH